MSNITYDFYIQCIDFSRFLKSDLCIIIIHSEKANCFPLFTK